MASQEDIDQQLSLLATYRRTLAHLLQQAAAYGGETYVPPNVANSIHEARENIERIKTTLRGWGVAVDDLPGDTAQPVSLSMPLVSFWQPQSRRLWLGAIGLLLALVVGVNVLRLGRSALESTPSTATAVTKLTSVPTDLIEASATMPTRAPASSATAPRSTMATTMEPTLAPTILQDSESKVNIAPLGSISVSSVSTQGGEDCQQGAKAVDGIISGYPEDPCSEWASDGELEGAWLKITFDVPHEIDKIVLFDRPTPDDQVLDATIRFNDGTTIITGQLPDEGGAKEIPVKPKIITSITVTVNKARGSVIGLSEIQVFGQ